MTEATKLIPPVHPEDPSLAQQVFDLCSDAAQKAGGYLVAHPAEHSINVVFGGHQVTITVEAHGK